MERMLESDPDWMRRRRTEAFERFAASSMPSEREELWRYVEIDFDLDEFTLAESPGTAAGSDEVAAAIGPAASIQVVDGFAVDGGSSASGCSVASLRAAAVEQGSRVAGTYERAGIHADDRFAHAHDAFGGDGAFIGIDPGALPAGPVYVDVQTSAAGLASFPAVVIDAGDGSEASVVVHLRSPQDAYTLAVPRIVAAVGADARLSVTVLQEWGYDARSVGHARLVADRDALVRFDEVGLGGRFSRLHLATDLDGRGSEAIIVGAYFGEEHQILDYRYFMRHAGPNTRSDMFLKGAVEDEATSVFTGMIRIEEEGQKTEAFQTNRNLILSKGASAQSVPNLEILANDVKCGHGSTVGPLDAEQRYYLMSRGLSRPRADRLQIRGFFEEALSRMAVAALGPYVRERLNRKFVAAQEAGRV